MQEYNFTNWFAKLITVVRPLFINLRIAHYNIYSIWILINKYSMDMTRLIQKFLLGHILFIYPTRRKRSSSVVSYNEQFTRSVISLYCISTTNCFSKRCINIAFLLTVPYYISNSFNVLTKKTECFFRMTAMPENAQNRYNVF